MAIIDSIKDKLGNIIYPKTLTKAIYEEGTNKRLDNILNELVDTDTIYTAGTNVAISETNVISAIDTNTTYSTGAGLTLTGTTLTPTWGVAANTIPHGNDTRFSDARTPLAHNQAISTITGLQGALDEKVNNSRVLTDVPLGAKFTDTVYTHPTTAGNKHIPTGGAVGQILKNTASGTAIWGNENNTTYTAGEGLILTGTKFTPDFGTTAGTVTQGNDSRLSNARTPTAHVHGNITNTGAIGTTANLMVQTTTSGVLTTKTAGTTAQYLRGDGSWATPPNTNTTYTEITTAEIDAGTASTLRTITARRVKYIIDKIVAMFPSKTSDLTNDSGFITSSAIPTSLPANGGNADTVGGFTVGMNVPAGSKLTDTVYSHPTGAGSNHIPTGGTVGQILKNTASGTATWQNETVSPDTTYTAGAGLTLTGTVFTPTFGTTAGTVTQGNDSRLTDARTPLAHDHNTIYNTKTEVTSLLGDKVDNSRVLTDVPANAKFTDTNTTYAEISEAEINTGTASTLRTITARRVTYIANKIVSALTKSDVGLGNVDNTSDVDKPVSTATQTALNGKRNTNHAFTWNDLRGM